MNTVTSLMWAAVSTTRSLCMLLALDVTANPAILSLSGLVSKIKNFCLFLFAYIGG